MSLRARLVAATTVVALIALMVAGIATYAVFTSTQIRPIDNALNSAFTEIEPLLSTGAPPSQSSVERAAPAMFVELRRADGTVVLSIPSRQHGDQPTLADLNNVAEFDRSGNPSDALAGRTRFLTVPVVTGDGPLRLRVSVLADGSVLAIGESLHEVDEARRRLISIQVGVAIGVLVVASVLGWLLVRVGLRPLRVVERTALEIAGGGNLDRDVPGADRPTEIGRLAAALNTMLGRIRIAFSERDTTEEALRASEQRMRQFVADVSHELRTPMAAISAYAELINRGASQHPDDLARALRGIGSETARMRDLVEELLLLARLDEGRPLAHDRVDLTELAVEAVRAAQAVAPDWPISLHLDDVISVIGDRSRIRQVIDNLLANVRTHTPNGTQTTVTISSSGASAVVSIRDNGQGMTTEQAGRVFERFYRADSSRSRTSGGAGLGLAIVSALVAAHHGDVRVETSPGNGMLIEIRLPAVPIELTDDVMQERQ